MKNLILASLAPLFCSGCAVVSVTGAVVSTGISVAGTVVSTGVSVAGSAVRGVTSAVSATVDSK